MKERAKQVALGLLFWIVFTIPTVIGLALLPFGILIFALGGDGMRAWVYRSGKSEDQFVNALAFGGLPQETISSHVGRYIQSGRPLDWRFRFVRWLTDKFEENHAVKSVEKAFDGADL